MVNGCLTDDLMMIEWWFIDLWLIDDLLMIDWWLIGDWLMVDWWLIDDLWDGLTTVLTVSHILYHTEANCCTQNLSVNYRIWMLIIYFPTHLRSKVGNISQSKYILISLSQKQGVVLQCPFTRLLSPLFLNTPLYPSLQAVTSY